MYRLFWLICMNTCAAEHLTFAREWDNISEMRWQILFHLLSRSRTSVVFLVFHECVIFIYILGLFRFDISTDWLYLVGGNLIEEICGHLRIYNNCGICIFHFIIYYSMSTYGCYDFYTGKPVKKWWWGNLWHLLLWFMLECKSERMIGSRSPMLSQKDCMGGFLTHGVRPKYFQFLNLFNIATVKIIWHKWPNLANAWEMKVNKQFLTKFPKLIQTIKILKNKSANSSIKLWWILWTM